MSKTMGTTTVDRPRRKSRPVKVRNLTIGGDNPILVQSMTKTDTRDVEATMMEIYRLLVAGCDIIRLAVPDADAAHALKEIRKQTEAPLVADIHFDYRLALLALDAGVDKLRINPGNIGGREKVETVVRECKARGVPMRIGVNAGSLEKDLVAKYGRIPEALVESAMRHVEMLEDHDFLDMVISLKSHDVRTMIAAYELIADRVPYALHLGVTEAGPPFQGTIKSSVGIGHLLAAGIGDTIRVSLTGDGGEEVKVGLEILYTLGIREKRLEIVACPSCGRCEIDLFNVVHAAEERLAGLDLPPMKVAIMGCVVNGPGESMEADVGLAGGNGLGVLFREGKISRRVKESEMVDALVEEVQEWVADKKAKGHV
ncbi:MAG TPA: flavodoxin-dependent (E)-4-hydroxy-3-methylbut-2-enyl-diphosphate synthase [Bacillota bacterium]|nr:flavodoxin-dependent (E)-4-hydroxy-3-methylbut-2-enyl-diphosphate synthase [Bacillota bacterium]